MSVDKFSEYELFDQFQFHTDSDPRAPRSHAPMCSLVINHESFAEKPEIARGPFSAGESSICLVTPEEHLIHRVLQKYCGS